MPTDTRQNQLRSETSWLGALLGRVITENAGQQGLDLVESIRQLSRDQRHGDASAAEKLRQQLKSLSGEQLQTVIRAFAIFLDLANLAEDRQRVRVLRERADDSFPAAPPESIASAVSTVLDAQGEAGLGGVLNRLELDLVMTAHPTEAKRRTVRRTLARLREILTEYDQHPTERQRSEAEDELLTELTTLWQTDMIRDSGPTVDQEARRSLAAKRVIWKLTAELVQELRQSVLASTSLDPSQIRPFVRLGSWVGGDRDGHPYVTCDVTRNTFQMLRQQAIQLHLETCSKLIDSFSLSSRRVSISPKLSVAIDQAVAERPELGSVIGSVADFELPRRWLRIIRHRLTETLQNSVLNDSTTPSKSAAGYASSGKLRDDILVLLASLSEDAPEGIDSQDTESSSLKPGAGRKIAERELQPWLDQIDAFGFHLARLDIRQNSVEYSAAIGEVFEQLSWTDGWNDLSTEQQQTLILERLDDATAVDVSSLSVNAQESLNLFRLLRQVEARFGSACIGGHVVSMTHNPVDILTVLWFWKWSGRDCNRTDSGFELEIIPLFETIEDLHQAAGTLDALLNVDAYRQHVTETGDRQTVMVGYSDSTKDGGYLAANWALYEGQQQMHAVTSKHGVEVVFFHGRGGSLGRGGGPAARAILSLPARTFHGAIRMTEQGEVLAERYDDPAIAHRHLEQLTWASILAANRREENVAEFERTAKQLAEAAFKKYRELVEHEHFVQFFQTITPISEIEQLQIGSRPSRRRGKSSLSDLRAIPWVFSWTQTRVMLPAWYGLGSAVRSLTRQTPEITDHLRQAYATWPYFRAMIDNAELALAKADMQVFRSYQELSESEEESIYLREIAAIIEGECERSIQAINQIKQQNKLLDGITWLAESIRVRNRYIDPLNLIQVELLGRLRRLSPDADASQRNEAQLLTRIAIKGIAAGMRTTG